MEGVAYRNASKERVTRLDSTYRQKNMEGVQAKSCGPGSNRGLRNFL